VIGEDDLCENPIFLIGVHRSGTSLLRRIIDSHSNIACPPETYFLNHFCSLIKDKDTFAGFRGLGYIDRDETLNEIRRWASRYHEMYRKAKGKGRWADKTPQYITALNELEEIFYNRARYIMIYRHPMDVVYSIYHRGWRFYEGHEEDSLLNAAYYVKGAVSCQLGFMKKHKGKCFQVKYEDVVVEPERARSVLQELFSFLGEPWEPGVLEYNNFHHDWGTEDPIVTGTNAIFDNRGKYKILDETKRKKIRPVLREIMDALDYQE